MCGLKQFGLLTSLDQPYDENNRELLRYMLYDVEQLSEYVDTNEPKLIGDQMHVYNSLMTSINHKRELFVLRFTRRHWKNLPH